MVFARVDDYQSRDIEVVNGEYKMLIVGPPTPDAFGHTVTFHLRVGEGDSTAPELAGFQKSSLTPEFEELFFKLDLHFP